MTHASCRDSVALWLLCCVWGGLAVAADIRPAPQSFQQEVSVQFSTGSGLPAGAVQLVTITTRGDPVVFIAGGWYQFDGSRWIRSETSSDNDFIFQDGAGKAVSVPVRWREVRQVVNSGTTSFVATASQLFEVIRGQTAPLPWNAERRIHQIGVGKRALHVASSEGLFRETPNGWDRLKAIDVVGRDWAAGEVLGVDFDLTGRLWLATRAGVGCQDGSGWRFYEGKDGLPWNDFTGIGHGQEGDMWFITHLGVIHFDGSNWQYRQGRLWLPDDDVTQVSVDGQGRAWFGTASGVGSLQRRNMTLAQKADLYEQDIEKFIKRTEFGFVAEAWLKRAGDKSSADPQDSDNDGLWTAMYGAGECFAFASTKAPQARNRAKKAFEALRFLQEITQGCTHAPPKGYVARTVRSVSLPDPNIGRLKGDLEEQKHDKLWKAYEPRWPRSADDKWFWKSDTSSDELDGHYFFYPLYYDLCADTEAERTRVAEVVRDLTDHLIEHEFCLIDHDGKPTRWGVYGPKYLNHDPLWWQERGLKSLSILCYLAVAAHVTGDAKYEKAAQSLIDAEAYAHNAMLPKVQHGPGSGNQSDDEMAFMCYYGLLNCSRDEKLSALIRYSFFNYWVNEAPEMNPFFNFAYAALNRDRVVPGPWGDISIKPWKGWFEDSMATLYGFPLDRRAWAHRNSHRLDIVTLSPVRSSDLDSPDRPRQRGQQLNGKVLPIENRHFNHWNTDPWQLDYNGNGGELAAGTVFLLPYYMGLYYGFIEKPVGN